MKESTKLAKYILPRERYDVEKARWVNRTNDDELNETLTRPGAAFMPYSFFIKRLEAAIEKTYEVELIHIFAMYEETMENNVALIKMEAIKALFESVHAPAKLIIRKKK